MKHLNRLGMAVAFMVIAVCGAYAQGDPTLDTVATAAQTAISTNILKVAGPAFVILALALGFGLLMRWLKRAAKSS